MADFKKVILRKEIEGVVNDLFPKTIYDVVVDQATGKTLSEQITDLVALIGTKATQADIDAAIAALVDGAPTALDTLRKLAEALQDADSDLAAILVTLETKVDKEDGKGLSTEDFTTTLKTKLEGLSNYDDTAVYEEIAKKVDKVTGKGLSTEDYTTAEKQKLADLSNFDPTSIEGDISELQSDIADLQSDVIDLQNNKVDKETGKGLSTNDFTDAYKAQLDEAIYFVEI